MEKGKGGILVLGVLAIAALAVGAFAFATAVGRAPAPTPTDRTIIMTAVEYKGTSGSSENPPNTTYKAYRWDPSYIMVNKGDKVTLKIFGVNGALHPASITGYGVTFTVTRGQWTAVEFAASKAGVFEIVCSIPEHTETMHAYLHVVG